MVELATKLPTSTDLMCIYITTSKSTLQTLCLLNGDTYITKEPNIQQIMVGKIAPSGGLRRTE